MSRKNSNHNGLKVFLILLILLLIGASAFMITLSLKLPGREVSVHPTAGAVILPTQAETEPPTEATKPTEGSASSGEGWMVPCTYRQLSSPFGERQSPTAGASSNHQGIDLAGPEGTPIYATKSGVVTVNSSSRSAGIYITIRHDNTYSSIYMHLSQSIVKKGQTIKQGQLIGYMGSTGIVTGSHLHFGIICNGSYVNPANYMYFHP
jgi:murein DD-endopeptidase MepM/ murein hydrolase activator NlpD